MFLQRISHCPTVSWVSPVISQSLLVCVSRLQWSDWWPQDLRGSIEWGLQTHVSIPKDKFECDCVCIRSSCLNLAFPLDFYSLWRRWLFHICSGWSCMHKSDLTFDQLVGTWEFTRLVVSWIVREAIGSLSTLIFVSWGDRPADIVSLVLWLLLPRLPSATFSSDGKKHIFKSFT